jgi:hypothetical protein
MHLDEGDVPPFDTVQRLPATLKDGPIKKRRRKRTIRYRYLAQFNSISSRLNDFYVSEMLSVTSRLPPHFVVPGLPRCERQGRLSEER